MYLIPNGHVGDLVRQRGINGAGEVRAMVQGKKDNCLCTK